MEILLIAEKFLNELGIRKKLKLELNSLGNEKTRKEYNKALTDFLSQRVNELSDISKERLKKNPMRVLDSKDPQGPRLLLKNLLHILEFLDSESKDFFNKLTKGLDDLKISYELNRFLVRGLDYYNHTAFEYITTEKKSQNALLAGGRYNGLVSNLGGGDLSGVGWAAGIERIANESRSIT